MCLDLFMIGAFPFFSQRMELLFSWCRLLSLTLYPCVAMKYWVQKMDCMKSSMPTIYVSVDLFELIFCFVKLTIGNPWYKDKPPPECPYVLGWTANDSSTHHVKIPLPLALRVSEILLVPLKYCIRCTNLAQLSSSCNHTLVVINLMAVQVSGLAFLVAYKLCATRLWNSMTLSWSNFLQS